MKRKKASITKRLAGLCMAVLLGTVGMVAMAATVSAQTPGTYGSITLDTASYTMAPGDRYTIGAYLKDGSGQDMDAQMIRALARAKVLSVRDSRTGSIVDLAQQGNGNFRVTAKNEGTCYIIYEIAGTHASIRIDVQKGVKAGGVTVRNTSYFTQELPEVKPIPDGPMVALTFDDGPNGAVTQKIVNVLKANDAKATFFMVGNRMNGDKETVRKVYEAGCEIASHTYSHANLTSLSASGIHSQIQQVQSVVGQIVPVTPKLLRPPYGAYNANVRNTAGMPLILWSIDTLDWQHRNSARTVQTVLSQVKDGDIVLMHDLQPSTGVACETLIPELKKRGFQLVTVSELIEYRGKAASAGTVYNSVR